MLSVTDKQCRHENEREIFSLEEKEKNILS